MSTKAKQTEAQEKISEQLDYLDYRVSCGHTFEKSVQTYKKYLIELEEVITSVFVMKCDKRFNEIMSRVPNSTNEK